MKRILLFLLPLCLHSEAAIFNQVKAPKSEVRAVPFRLERQKKLIQAEIQRLHQLFDPKSTISYDVRFLETGERVLERFSDQRLYPGSLIGLATTISALELLGREFSFQSSVWIKEPLNPSMFKKGGVFTSDLYVDLSLDPHLEYGGMLNLAEQMKKKGILSIQGRIFFEEGRPITTPEGWDLLANDPASLYLRGEIPTEKGAMLRSQAFLMALKEKGIDVKEAFIDTLDTESLKKNLLAEVSSSPLIPLIQRGWAEKDKATFEALIRAIGEKRQKSNRSLRTGVLQMRDFLSMRALLNCDEMALFDGSGTSSLSLLSPRQFTTLLLFAKNQFHLDADFLTTLPVLKLNASGKGQSAFARAILFTQGNSASIAGVIESQGKRKIAFCCIVNNATRENEKAESFLKAFCQTLYEDL